MVKYNEEKETVIASGTLVKLAFGRVPTGKNRVSDKDYFQVSVLIDPLTNGDTEAMASILDKYYKDLDPHYIPKWLLPSDASKDNDNTDEAGVYLNCKSLFDFPLFYVPPVENNGEKVKSTCNDFLAKYGAPVGSRVAVSLRCKPGALYIAAIRVDNLKIVTEDDFF